MAQRYCTNCGNELGPNDAFGANCGKPAHQVAAVATPEADVDVPPPPGPSAGGTGSYTASAPTSVGTAPEGEQPKKRGCIFYLVVTVVVLFVVVQLGSLGGNEEGGSGG